jgi:hypothetical protein
LRELPKYQDLSGEQQEVYELPLDGNYLVSGPPGTGKTVMALYRAQQYRKAGREVVLLSFNRLLNDFMGEGARSLGIRPVVVAYTMWLKTIFNGSVPLVSNPKNNWDYDWNEIIQRATELPRLDCLIIDEGQDMPREFYFFVKQITDHLTVFADENQRIFEEQSTIADIRTWLGNPPEYLLTANYRNTRTIAELAARFYTGLQTGIPNPPVRGEHEPKIVVKRVQSDVESAHQIVARAKLDKDNPDRTVGVFAPDKTAAWFMRYRFDEDTELELREEKNDVWPKVLQHYYAWSRGRPPAPETIFGVPGVYLTNLFNSKGLEFETVYLVRLQRLYRKLDDPMTLMLFYVAIARARSTIEFHYSGSEEPEIIGFLRNTGLDITFET